MPRSPDFFRQLNEQTLEALEERARQPGVKLDEIVSWLNMNGVEASRSAVGRWWQDFRLEDRTRRAHEVARQYLATARETDPTAVTEASLRKFEELVFEALSSGDELDSGELLKLAMAMKAGLGSRKEIVELRRQQVEAVKEAEAAARSGGTAADVVDTIKRALGISKEAA